MDMRDDSAESAHRTAGDIGLLRDAAAAVLTSCTLMSVGLLLMTAVEDAADTRSMLDRIRSDDDDDRRNLRLLSLMAIDGTMSSEA